MAYKRSWHGQKPPCTECGKTIKNAYNDRSRVCSPECARARKSRLQSDRRKGQRSLI